MSCPLVANAQSGFTNQKIHLIDQTQRLSAWLQTDSGKTRLEFDAGLAWLSSENEPLQQANRMAVRSVLQTRAWMAAGDPLGANRLLRLLDVLPYSGRVPLRSADGRWLEVNPSFDPVLKPGDRLISFSRPTTVTVLLSNGQICNFRHTPGQSAIAYARQCADEQPASLLERFLWQEGPNIWIGQPDGQTVSASPNPFDQRVAVEPAPGAWVWAPGHRSGFDEAFSAEFAAVLAMQGPAGGYLRPLLPEQLRISLPARSAPKVSRSQWGSVGLIQMPSGRMAPDSELSVSHSRTDPYWRTNVFMQVLPWMEFGFRYTDIRNRYYGQFDFSGTQTYKDKSIDAKFRLFQETEWRPEVSVGLIDVGGTGLFSSEFLAATKRFGNLDITGGLAWGYLGSGGTISNPIGLLRNAYKFRQGSDTGPGGQFAAKSWFTGPMSPFAGVEYQTPWPNWVMKVEYDANNYSAEPYRGGSIYTVAEPRSRFNYGLVYRLSDWVDFSLGYERGNQISAGVVLHAALNKPPAPKLLDPPPLPVQASAQTLAERAQAAWQSTREEIEQTTSWRVASIERDGSDLYVSFAETYGLYIADRVESIARILHRDAPSVFQRFVIQIRNKSLPVTTIAVDRHRFVEDRTQLVSAEKKALYPAVAAATPQSFPPTPRDFLDRAGPDKDQFRLGNLSGGVGMSYAHHLGGPNGFWIYQIGANARAEWRLREDTWLIGIGNYRLIDNYDNFTINSTSQLPQVRTRMREYYTTSRWTLPVVQLTHMGSISAIGPGHYYAVYGGMLEWMFAGYGAEYLWRPWASRFALGVDVNRVQQRDYQQDFGLRDYRVTTGHVSGYWDTGWNNVLVTLKAGQYLAGDRGITADLSRVFSNGIVFGMYATKTNVSAETFGEGSFDKGIYLRIPFDALLPKRSAFSGTFLWQPITRDGGAILGRRYPLHGMTEHGSARALSFGSP